jgi:long-chain acyl-CoA synthetase
METTFPRLLLQHAAQRPAAAAMREKEYGIWQTLTWAALAHGGAPRLRPAPGRACARRAHGGDRRQPAAPVRHHAGRAGAGRDPVPLYQDAVAAECVFPINNADVRFAFVEDQEQVDKLLEIRGQCPQLQRSGSTTRAACATTASRPALAGRAAGSRRALLRAAQPGFFQARSTRPARRRGRDVLHLGHHRQAQGRGAHPPHAARPRQGRRRVRQAHRAEEVLAYLPPAWVGQNIFSYAQWLACGYVVNCPESAGTVMIDLKEIGPTYYFAPPRIFEGLLTTVMIRMEDASAHQARHVPLFMDVAAASARR